MGLFDIFKVKQFKTEIEELKHSNEEANQKLHELGAFDYFQIKEMTSSLQDEYEKKRLNEEQQLKELSDKILELRLEESKLIKNNKTQTNKLARSKELIKAINYSLESYLNYEPAQSSIKLPQNDLNSLEEISPSVILKLHCMDVKDLRKAYRENDKQINSILEKYSARYTTKANQAIYKLMVIALRAELQNVLYNLKYEKLDKSIDDVKAVTQKYLKIASEGNQSIAGTLSKFIGEIEYLFINAVKIEYSI